MRAFVVGNGPSLKHTQLDKLDGEISFACNNIHTIYPYTSWRPTHYVRAEEATGLEVENWLKSILIHLELGCEMYTNDYFFRPQFGTRRTDKCHTIKACAHYAKHYDDLDTPQLWHLPVLCTFGSSVNVAVQLATILGYSPIYLVGCDLGYKDGQPNHYDPAYEHGHEQEARYANLDTLMAHIIAKRSRDDIFNATIGGELEVYERVRFETLFDR